MSTPSRGLSLGLLERASAMAALSPDRARHLLLTAIDLGRPRGDEDDDDVVYARACEVMAEIASATGYTGLVETIARATIGSVATEEACAAFVECIGAAVSSEAGARARFDALYLESAGARSGLLGLARAFELTPPALCVLMASGAVAVDDRLADLLVPIGQGTVSRARINALVGFLCPGTTEADLNAAYEHLEDWGLISCLSPKGLVEVWVADEVLAHVLGEPKRSPTVPSLEVDATLMGDYAHLRLLESSSELTILSSTPEAARDWVFAMGYDVTWVDLARSEGLESSLALACRASAVDARRLFELRALIVPADLGDEGLAEVRTALPRWPVATVIVVTAAQLPALENLEATVIELRDSGPAGETSS